MCSCWSILGFVIHGYLGGRVLIAKSAGLALSVASGLQLGKEGPVSVKNRNILSIIAHFVLSDLVCSYRMLYREYRQPISK